MDYFKEHTESISTDAKQQPLDNLKKKSSPIFNKKLIQTFETSKRTNENAFNSNPDFISIDPIRWKNATCIRQLLSYTILCASI